MSLRAGADPRCLTLHEFDASTDIRDAACEGIYRLPAGGVRDREIVGAWLAGRSLQQLI
jgi:hypothetical protein